MLAGSQSRGSLFSAVSAPDRGEAVDTLAIARGFRVEEIRSGELDSPQDYNQDHDEWCLVISGAATLEVSGERCDLAAGDWILLAAGVRHRLLATQPGTVWIAIHGDALP